MKEKKCLLKGHRALCLILTLEPILLLLPQIQLPLVPVPVLELPLHVPVMYSESSRHIAQGLAAVHSPLSSAMIPASISVTSDMNMVQLQAGHADAGGLTC